MDHRSLANKYRPSSFAELKGQKVLIKTVTNAIRNGKPYPAYLLSGIRGIGKTTSARIIAKTLNCSELKGDMPCGECKSCLAIQNNSHPDIIELDAASKTGVNDVREIIDSARYVPLLSKYKIYIIDEVHMLSNSAFNALLKILEEPPVNVIFIFATTEFRKIPMTVISRCQKFDLHRFTSQDLTDHLKEISDKEGIKYKEDGLKEIVKYSEGSVRDGISILETISMYNEERYIDSALVREVLGIPDADCKYRLFEAILNGNVETSLNIINEIYYSGEELSNLLEELLFVTNSLSKILSIKGYFSLIDLSDSEKSALQALASQTDIINLTSLWQMIFKGCTELKISKNRLQTVEMLIIRICYLSELPSLEKIISEAKEDDREAQVAPSKPISSFSDVAELFRKNKEMILYHQLMEEVNLVSFAPNRLEIRIPTSLPNNFLSQVKKKLEEWTGQAWQIITSSASKIAEANTLRVQEKEQLKTEDGLVKDILESFPGAKVKTVVGMDNT